MDDSLLSVFFIVGEREEEEEGEGEREGGEKGKGREKKGRGGVEAAEEEVEVYRGGRGGGEEEKGYLERKKTTNGHYDIYIVHGTQKPGGRKRLYG